MKLVLCLLDSAIACFRNSHVRNQNFIGAPMKILSADLCKILLYYWRNDHLSNAYNVGILKDLCFYLHQCTHSQTTIIIYSILSINKHHIISRIKYLNLYNNLINNILLQGSNIWHGTKIRLSFTLHGKSPRSPCFWMLVSCILAYLTKHIHQIQNTVPTHWSSVHRATALTYESDDPSE